MRFPDGPASLAPLLYHWSSPTTSFFSSAGISLFGPGDSDQFIFQGSRIEGNYTVFLQAGIPLLGTTSLSTSLAQDGLVPLDSQSLLLRINAFGPFDISLGGEMLSLIPLSVTPNYTLYGAEISRFAGQEAELRITAVDSFNPNNGLHTYLWVDSISFSPMAVPEPSTVMLIAAGGMLFGLRWRMLARKRRHRAGL